MLVRSALSHAITTMLLGLSLGFMAGAAAADPVETPATFTLLNKSGFNASQAKFYYLGAGQDADNNFIVLMPDGSWARAGSPNTGWNPTGWNPNANGGSGGATGAGVVPCYRVRGGETITIPLNAKSMRVYIFQAKVGSGFFSKPCMTAPSPTGDQKVRGIFNTRLVAGSNTQNFAPFSYSILTGNGAYAGLSLSKLKAGFIPPWSFAEIALADIDTSQVDAIAFPLNVTAKMTASPGQSHPVWNQGVGFSFSSNSQVNMQAVLASYKAFTAKLPLSGGTTDAPTKPQYSYGKLQVTYPSGTFLTNPGNYLGHIKRNGTAFQYVYLNLVNNYLWSSSWAGSIDLGSEIANLPHKLFSGSVKTLPSYPGYSGGAPLTAIKFEGGGVAAYVLSPVSYQALCAANAIPGSCGYMSPAYQIFATDGALNTPIDDNQFQLLSRAERDAWTPYGGAGTYNLVVARLGFIMSMALNHGVAGGLATPGGLCADATKYHNVSECWSDQTLWYPRATTPAEQAKYFGHDTTQNEFARWLHTAQIGTGPAAIPMMTRPTNPTTTASGIMGMGYGFAADENPTPLYPTDGSTTSQTPSEYSSNVAMAQSTGCNFITIMPMRLGKPNATPVMPACEGSP